MDSFERKLGHTLFGEENSLQKNGLNEFTGENPCLQFNRYGWSI